MYHRQMYHRQIIIVIAVCVLRLCLFLCCVRMAASAEGSNESLHAIMFTCTRTGPDSEIVAHGSAFIVAQHVSCAQHASESRCQNLRSEFAFESSGH